MGKLAVIAIGGNSLIKDKQHQFIKDQYEAICETVKFIVDIIEEGYEVIVTHGNGPQVGFIMRRSEIAEEIEHMHPVPLVNCDADTQGAIGYQIQQALQNEFIIRGINKQAVTVVTQVEVDKDDTAFKNPVKPIGTFYNQQQLINIKKEHPDWKIESDSNRGYRRVVPSPMPIRIVERKAIEQLIKASFTVIAVGGGGIPVVKDINGTYKGINAVIDKDYASSMLASKLNADLFIISTDVSNVCINYGKANEKKINNMSLVEAKKLKEEGHFAIGSMLPKVNAAILYLNNGGQKAIITSPQCLKDAINDKAGTLITNYEGEKYE